MEYPFCDHAAIDGLRGGVAEGASSAPMPDLSINHGVCMPSRAELEEYQLIEMMQEPLAFSKEVPETQQEVDLLLDSNYAMISQLVRLRHTREAGKPRRVERKLMAMLEKNLAKLVACHSPSALVTPRTAQATRAIMRQAKETELVHAQGAQAAAPPHQPHMMQGAGVQQQGSMQGGMQPAMQAGMLSQGQMQQQQQQRGMMATKPGAMQVEQHLIHQSAPTYGGGSSGGFDGVGGGIF